MLHHVTRTGIVLSLLAVGVLAQSFDCGPIAASGWYEPSQSWEPSAVVVAANGTVWESGRCTTAGGTGSYPTLVNTGIAVAAVARKYSHTLALATNGTVLAWGRNSRGQLGNGTYVDSLTPVTVTGLTNVIAVAAGSNCSYALESNGTVWGWGSSQYGSLGVGVNPTNNPNLPGQSTPVQVAGLAGVIGIAAGNVHAAALLANGTVWCWGQNFIGELGQATITGGNSTWSGVPLQVPGLTGITGISAGYYQTLALDAAGAVHGWSSDPSVQLVTTGTLPALLTGLPPLVSVVAGHWCALGRTANGDVWVWGADGRGQCGVPLTSPAVSYSGAWGAQINPPLQLPAPNSVVAIAAGADASLALRSDGTVWSWGSWFLGLGLAPLAAQAAYTPALGVDYGPPNFTPTAMPPFGVGYMGTNTPMAAAAGGVLQVQMTMPAAVSASGGPNLPVVVLVDPLLGPTPLPPNNTSQLAFSPYMFALADALGIFGPLLPGSGPTSPTTDLAGHWNWYFNLPPSPAFAGATLYVEGFALTPSAANGFYLQTANAATVSLY